MLRRAAWRKISTLEDYLGALAYRNDMRTADYVDFFVDICVAKREGSYTKVEKAKADLSQAVALTDRR